MNKALPYVVAAVLGLGVAGLMWLGMSDASSPTAEAPEGAASSGGASKRAALGDNAAEGEAALPPKTATGAGPLAQQDGPRQPPPPPGTLRPLNAAELAYAERQSRPYNLHYDHVSSYWRRAVQLLSAKDRALAADATAMDTFLRGGTRLNAGELDVTKALEDEKALIQRIRSAGLGDSELDSILCYIDQSAGVALQGGDVSTVPRPPKPA